MTRHRHAQEDGFVLATAMLLLMIIMSVGLVVVAFVDRQQTAAGVERTRESSFQITEAALNGQVFQLARSWAAQPATGVPTYPLQCDPSSASTTPCPDPAGIQNGYNNGDHAAATCGGTASVPWTTAVRDNGVDATTGIDTKVYYQRAPVDAQPTYDANKDNQVWVRATGVASCRVQTVVARVAQRFMTLSFPQNVVSANWFTVLDSGNKAFVDSKGVAPQPAPLVVRCTNLTDAQCLTYDTTKGQISPDTSVLRSPTPAKTVTDSQLDSFRRQAQAAGTYYTGCPPNPPGVTGQVVFVEDTTAGCPTYSGGNSRNSPGFLVIARGGITFGANHTFYGVIYAANLTNLTSSLVSVGGNGSIQGAVAVDGLGGVSVGNSKRPSIAYDPKAFGNIKVHAGASIVQNSWRVLPRGQ